MALRMAGNRMKKFLTLSLMGLASAGAFAQFFPLDSLIVSRYNGFDGTATTIDLVGLSYSGTANGKVFALSGAGTAGIRGSGSATSEGAMNASAGFIGFAGYVATTGTASVSSTSGIVRRVAAFNNAGAGSVTYTDVPSGVYTTNNIRSAYTSDGSNFLLGGAGSSSSGGTRTFDGTTVGAAFSGVTNSRVTKVINGVSYFSNQSTTGGNTASLLDGAGNKIIDGITGKSFYDFEQVTQGTNNYWLVADDSLGLQVWQTGGTSALRTIALPSSATGLRSLAVRNWDVNGVQKTTIFGIGGASATTASALGTQVFAMTFDSGTLLTTSSTFSSIAQAPAGTNFRGIEVVPEPASMAVLGLGLLGLARRRRNK